VKEAEKECVPKRWMRGQKNKNATTKGQLQLLGVANIGDRKGGGVRNSGNLRREEKTKKDRLHTFGAAIYVELGG